jgi:hypothetical protein
MRRKIELIAVSIFILLILVVSLVYSYWESLPYASYKIGDEIKGFPADGISMTITNFSTSPDLTFPTTSEDVTLNVTIRNLASYPIYFNQTDFQTKLDQAASKHLDLKYKVERGVGETSAWNYTDWWGITVFGVQKNQFNWLAANESVNGSIRFVLGNETYSSLELVCRSTSQQKPLFNVNLAQG